MRLSGVGGDCDARSMSAVELANLLILPYLNHAVAMSAQRYATRDDIDTAMRYGCGLPVGPLQLVDELGVAHVRDGLARRFAQTGDPLHQPHPLLSELLAADRGGRECGRGFYTYGAAGSREVLADEASAGGVAGDQHIRAVDRVGVVGSGTMATGIAEVVARAGLDVVVVARSQDKVDAVLRRVRRSQDTAIERGRTTPEQADALLARIAGATERDALGEVDLVIEAVAEDLAIKRQLFADLDRICRDGTILATTTSSLPIAECAAATSRPADVVGMHFFNPAPAMKLVEVVHTSQTAPDVLATVTQVCARIGKVDVSCGDRAGFIVNALLFPYLNDAIMTVEQTDARVDEVDEAIVQTYAYPMGPFALLDVVGLDVSLAIQRELHREFGYDGYAPAASLVDLVEAGHLGRKTGRGFLSH